jgi:integrase
MNRASRAAARSGKNGGGGNRTHARFQSELIGDPPEISGEGVSGAVDLGAASQALGHSDLSTTASIYGHYDLLDLERAMEALAQARRKEDEPVD